MKSKNELTRHVAFLRGINVSGQKIIKMVDLAKLFTSFGFKNVRTFIQSGNVIFDSTEQDIDSLTEKIEKNLAKKLGYQVDVMVRTLQHLESILKRNPFKKLPPDAKISVVFMSGKPTVKPKLPLLSPKKDLELIEIRDRDAF